MCVCVCVGVEIVDCGESDKVIKISGKMDKSDSYKGFSCDILFLIQIIQLKKYFCFSTLKPKGNRKR